MSIILPRAAGRTRVDPELNASATMAMPIAVFSVFKTSSKRRVPSRVGFGGSVEEEFVEEAEGSALGPPEAGFFTERSKDELVNRRIRREDT